jgi:hypothetical protein
MHDFQKTVTSALKLINNYLLLRDDFRIGLVISLRVAVLASGQYSYPRTNN